MPLVRYLMVFFLVIALPAGIGSVAAQDAAPFYQAQDDNFSGFNPKIETALLQVLHTQGQSDFYLRFVQQPDLRPAFGMDWEARGWFVYEALKQTAETSQADAKQYLDEQGVAYRSFFSSNTLLVEGGDLLVLQVLAELPEVLDIALPKVYAIPPIINEGGVAPLSGSLTWGITDTKADQFWASYGKGQNIIVASIDTGVQWNHPALVDRFRCGSNPSDPACWRDPSNICGGSACDNNGHGTHVTGTMVGKDDSSLQWRAGMAPEAQWIACKGCESNWCSHFALHACADWILAPDENPSNRPHIVNNSWGGAGGRDFYRNNLTAWRAAGIFPAFSAGNSGSGCGTLGSPGDNPESFGTAAHASNRTIASFSSRGPSAFGDTPYTQPNISAPGVSVWSSVPNNSWGSYSGTSMASPHSAGAVALLWSCNPALVGQIDQTIQILQTAAGIAPSGNCGAPASGQGNYTFGYGYLDVLEAGVASCGPSGTLQGVVRSLGDNLPISGAGVAAQETAGPASASTVSNLSGEYRLVLPPGDYTVIGTAFGYLPALESSVSIAEDDIINLDLWLQPLSPFEWGWLTGAATHSQFGIYGARGTPAARNTPGARYAASAWSNPGMGQLWLFGGMGFDSSRNWGYLNDLWSIDLNTRNWVWMHGANIRNQIGIYGVQGTPSAANTPGARWGAAAWTDGVGNMWLMGGMGYDGDGRTGRLNDLWKRDAGSWVWIKGASSRNQPGVYGVQGIPHSANTPGARYGSVAWTDIVTGRLWLFGGMGYDGAGHWGHLNDLWRFDPDTENWTWIKGASTRNQAGNYGSISATRTPGARWGAAGWVGPDGNLWLFGGEGLDRQGNEGYLSDLWEFNRHTEQWAYRKGASVRNQPANYGARNEPHTSNTPGARAGAMAWSGSDGSLWLFGGRGYTDRDRTGYLNDQWHYNPSDSQWVWVKGTALHNRAGIYGTRGVPDIANMPGARGRAATWSGTHPGFPTGAVCFFGGYGYDVNRREGYLNDLWCGASASFSGGYGALRVEIEPVGARTDGGQWRRLGTSTWYSHNHTETLVPVGNHVVEFRNIDNWAKPASQPVTINENAITHTTGTYTQTGALRVLIEPDEAIAAGARWRRTGTSAWLNSGHTETGLAVGTYTVEFNIIADWTSPASQTVTVTHAATATATGVYIQHAVNLQVFIEPEAARTAGAQWRRTGTTTWRNSGDVETGVPAGQHIVEFREIAGWQTPDDIAVIVTGDHSASTARIATYTQSSYTVTASAGSGGSVTPASRTVESAGTASFSVTPDAGHTHGAAGGTCPGGAFSGNTYTTGAVTSDCTVNFNFLQTPSVCTQPVEMASAEPRADTPSTWQFAWNGIGADQYWLQIGSRSGRSNYYNQSVSIEIPDQAVDDRGIAYTETVTGLPTDGSVFYVRLWTRCGSRWLHNNYTYSASTTETQHTVSATAGASGSVSPASRTVSSGATTTFTVTPDAGYTHGKVGGACPAGAFSGNTYTTGAITSDCAVSFSFVAHSQYTVSATAGASGSVSPASRTVSSGATTTFTVTPDAGYIRGNVGGTCPVGAFSGNIYTTGAITSDCAVSFSFSEIPSTCTQPTEMTSAEPHEDTPSTWQFMWNGIGADQYWLQIGSRRGRSNHYNQSVSVDIPDDAVHDRGVEYTETVTGLPTDGSIFYVRLWTRCGSRWLHNNYTY